MVSQSKGTYDIFQYVSRSAWKSAIVRDLDLLFAFVVERGGPFSDIIGINKATEWLIKKKSRIHSTIDTDDPLRESCMMRTLEN